jgi:hypothetical protein
MVDAIRQAFQSAGGPLTRADIKAYIDAHYPGEWQPSTLGAHLYGCVVNNPKAYVHHKNAPRFLFRQSGDLFELYDDQRHGPNVWAPLESPDGVEGSDTEELIEASISLERDLESHLVQSLGRIESGLTYVDRQVNIDVGRVDILARDISGTTVVLELKVGEAGDASIGQIARYLGWYGRGGERVRGILIAADFPERVKYAASAIPNLALRRFQVRFEFESVGL